jgi:hypothetical protein
MGGLDAGNGQDRSRIGCLGAIRFGRGRLPSGIRPADPIDVTRTSLARLDMNQGEGRTARTSAMGHEPPLRSLAAVTGLHPIPAAPSRAWGGS